MGREVRKDIGSLIKVVVDANDRAWALFLRAKVLVELLKPLLRCI